MAFDHPIEADRIDDFNLFSAFVRAPLWILGGVLGGRLTQQEEEDCNSSCRLDDDSNVGCSSSLSPTCSPRRGNSSSLTQSRTSPLSTLEVWGDAGHEFSHNLESAHLAANAFNSAGSETNNVSNGGLKRTKKMSWSDESGQRLCEIINIDCDEVSEE